MIQEVATSPVRRRCGAEKWRTWPSRPPGKAEPTPTAMQPSELACSVFAKAETTRHFSEVRIGPCERRGSHLQIPPQKQACQAESLQEKLGSPPPPGPRLRASRREDETYFAHLFFIDYFFRAAKMRGRYRDLMDPWSPHRHSLPPPINMISVIRWLQLMTHQYHPKPRVYMGSFLVVPILWVFTDVE